MTPLQTNISEFMLKAGQVVRSKPTKLTPSEAILRARLVLEEAFELAEALGVDIDLPETGESIYFKTLMFDQNGEQDLVATADAIADLSYVNIGTAVACGIDMEPVDAEVHKSNMSKFIDGYVDADGKYRKGPSYKAPNLKPILEAQGK